MDDIVVLLRIARILFRVGKDTNFSVKSVFIGVKDTPQCDITDQPVHHAAFIYAQIALKNGYMGKRACLKVSIRHPGEGYPAADKIGDSAQIQRSEERRVGKE